MKNIHVLQTEKLSRLFQIENDVLRLDHLFSKRRVNKHIYITSDEEIKEGDWYHHLERKTVHNTSEKADYFINNTKYIKFKKIILTTDQDLIKDGVQKIDDEFLEWFVKNQNYEYVKVEDYGNLYNFRYLILIPKEESKQETLEEVRKVERTELFNSIYSVVKKIPRKDVDGDAMDAPSCAYELEQLFYKWQAERMYSEEDMKDYAEYYNAVANPKTSKDYFKK